ncbi:MAG: GNAT family N-acetyltransferase [Spirochaetales bacterium]|nr:GNAT family N-acetyltransferase [Spirochaetales bacterium]
MKKNYTLKVFKSISEIPREGWNSLTTDRTIPFLDWEWLAALEQSGSVASETHWFPLHLTLWDKEKLVAAAPFYLRTSSRGEYVYDYFWAEAAASLGRPWYPKLVGVIPATPAEGYRFLYTADMDPLSVTRIFLSAAENICRKNGIAGLHILFADPVWGESLADFGYTAWEHSHFVWENSNYQTFDDYLARFDKNQRKNIRKEYHHPEQQGINIRVVCGEQATKEHFRRMFELFTLTNDKFIPWDARYINEDFFLCLEKDFRKNIAFVEARRTGPHADTNTDADTEKPLALAFLIRKGENLWGRYWGAYNEIKDLHFAACYYTPIEWAIREGIRFFDPGAGSPHKVRRGFRLAADKSWHRFFDPVLEEIFKNNIDAVNEYERQTREELNAQIPFKTGQTR